MSPDELESELATGSGSGKLYVSCSLFLLKLTLQAIKIVERNPKKKRLAGLTQRGGRTDGNRVAENE
jgi:hypothetical protein